MARTTVKQLLQTKQMRLIQERLSKGVLTFKDLKALIPRDDDRAEVLTLMLHAGMVEATFYPSPLPGQEVQA